MTMYITMKNRDEFIITANLLYQCISTCRSITGRSDFITENNFRCCRGSIKSSIVESSNYFVNIEMQVGVRTFNLLKKSTDLQKSMYM